ncbi:MAG: acyl-CoA thioesterase [Bacteroidota bacterium]
MPFSYEFTVTKDLLDNYGHVNNANYLRLYEDARWDILQKSDLGEESINEHNTGPVILEVTVRFSNELRVGQKVIIETTSRRKGSKLFFFDQVMKDLNGTVFSKAVFTAALFDLKNRKMIIPDEKWLKAFGF